MTAAEFERLLSEVSFRLRLTRALGDVFRLAAGALAILSLAVLLAKLLPVGRPWLASCAAMGLAALAILGAFTVAWLRRPVSHLTAAAEVDRVAGLKERASALVAVRLGAAPRTAVFAALELDAAEALAPLDREAVLRAALPALPDRARWLVGLGTLALALLLVPPRAPRGSLSLAEMLADGGVVIQGIQAQAGGRSDPKTAGEPRSPAARKVLTLLKGPPPSNAGDAEKQKKDLLALAKELRQSDKPGDRALARQIEDLAAQLARINGVGTLEATPSREPTEGGTARTARAAYLRSHPEYADLLARYFGAE
jgi:hypothetical protein